MRKILTVPFVLVVLLAVPMVHAQDDSRLPAAPGSMVDIGGYNLHLYCIGEGSPTVVIDAGLGDWSLHFRSLQERVAEYAHVCTFDRAGYGWSEAGPEPRTSQQIVDELKMLLETAEVGEPYVLVGHSFGGLNMILFANEHPDLVAGVVLIDSSHPDQVAQLEEAAPEMVALQDKELEGMQALADAAAQGQVAAADILPLAPQGIPENLREMWVELQLLIGSPSLMTTFAEYDALDQSMAQVREKGSLGSIPLIVIAHGLKLGDVMPPEAREQSGLTTGVLDRYESIWRSLQEDHLTRSRNSRLIVAQNSPHYVYVSEPELVTAAIGTCRGGRVRFQCGTRGATPQNPRLVNGVLSLVSAPRSRLALASWTIMIRSFMRLWYSQGVTDPRSLKVGALQNCGTTCAGQHAY